MKKLTLDFSKTAQPGIAPGGIMLLIAGLAASIIIAMLHNEAKLEQRQIQATLDKKQAATAARSVSTPQGADAALQYQQAAAVIDQLSFPWDRLFQAIERNTGADTALLTIQPNLEAKSVVLDAEAKNWASMLAYIQRLEADGFFSDVHLVSHQIQQSDPQKPLRFRLDCRWHSLLNMPVATSSASGQ